MDCSKRKLTQVNKLCDWCPQGLWAPVFNSKESVIEKLGQAPSLRLQSKQSDCLNDSGKLLITRLYLRSILGSTLIPRSRARTGNVRDRDFKKNKPRFSGD